MYQAHTYARLPQAPQMPPAQRRHPLTNAVNHHVNHQATPPKPPPKAPASPPLPRQNSKTTPPSPPKIITDKSGRLQFNRVGFLGEGGFARVYEVKDARGARLACKVVTKDSLKTKKAKTKLYAEIKIHRSLEHPNIVNFQDCFEDNDNVYMTLELCPSGSLMDMLRRRRRFTEAESRFFMVQLIGACHYMHTHQVIHRDLKLGNLFLDQNMNVKVGDFGLAALIENPGERKKTICGTPNYIAPEVLFDTANGHSFEVDTWSIGVILYTLVVGRPPFQTKDVKAISKNDRRIRDNEYEFPADRAISSAVQNLIQQILTPNPSQRPTLHEIVDHAFFVQGPVPSYIPTSAHDAPPDFRHISRSASEHNLKRLRKYALLDIDYSSLPPSSSGGAAGSQQSNGVANTKNVATSIAQQEKEFQKAVQPGSPISALLSSARQPLLVGNPGAGGPGGARDSPLLRKLQAVKESPLGRRTVVRGLDGIVEERDRDGVRRRLPIPVPPGGVGMYGSDDGMEHEDVEEEEMRLRKKELEAQKARIVAQMAPVREEVEEEQEDELEHERARTRARREEEEMQRQQERERYKVKKEPMRERQRERYGENVAPQMQHAQSKYGSLRTRSQGLAVDKENVHNGGYAYNTPTPAPLFATHHPQSLVPTPAAQSVTAQPPPEPQVQPQPKPNGFDAAAQTLCMAFDAKATGRVFRDPMGNHPLPDEKVFIVSWVDYCNKYGMGYALTDGSVGVHFNDSTTLVLSPDKVHFDYVTSRRQGSIYVRKSFTVEIYPEELKSKVYLLKHFERYIMDRLYGEYDYTFEDTGREKGMEFVQKYLRMKHVIVFKLSHDVLQFNFYDHSKLILSSSGLVVTHIDKHYKMTRHSLSDIMAQALSYAANPASAATDHDGAKFNQRMMDKLKYCKEVLVSIRNATGSAGPEEPEMGIPASNTAGTMGSRASKNSLR